VAFVYLRRRYNRPNVYPRDHLKSGIVIILPFVYSTIPFRFSMKTIILGQQLKKFIWLECLQVSIVHICEGTLTKRLIEFENTDSGSLTVSML
jgi:hypothetical protein